MRLKSLSVALAVAILAILVVPLMAGAAPSADRGNSNNHSATMANDDRDHGDRDDEHQGGRGRQQGIVRLADGREVSMNAIPITGAFTDSLGKPGQFVGTFHAQRFFAQNGSIYLRGLLKGTLTDSTGAALGKVTKQIDMPIGLGSLQPGPALPESNTASGVLGFFAATAFAQAPAACNILNLVLGPLHLNLLGLVVDLNQVVLNITAQPGPGNLLGNLLCDVANLLNGGTPLSQLLGQITSLLNQILARLP